MQILLIIVALFFSCAPNSSSPDENGIKVTYSGTQIGGLITVSGVTPLLKRIDYLFTFPGVEDPLFPDSISGDKLYSHIPYGAVNGQMEILAQRESLHSATIKVSEECPDSVVVKWTDLPVTIREQDSYAEDLSGFIKWQGLLNRDTVTLVLAGLCGEECSYTIELRFKNIAYDNLPEFISMIRRRTDLYSGAESDTLKAAIIKFQDYSTNGIISGKVFSSYWEPTGLTFWYEFGKK